ncbi:MAG TPA: hypothetical protein QF776_10500, partial [Acidimicrobiales bacterium]|nr:hypothetical protein [Acidimicrobiales bacterium]
ITDHAWLSPDEALTKAHEKSIEILPPTWVTLFDLSQFSNVDEAIQSVASRGPRAYATKIVPTSEGLAAVWEGDSEYATDHLLTDTQRHRLVMTETTWKFQLGMTVE